jgi:diphthine-ammonia ligase
MASKTGLKVIALISGGKDSLFSILHCLANGHEIVALGNLYPDDVKVDNSGQQIENEQDTDSYMYQTVGHSVVAHYAEALDIPVYRHPLSGRAVDKSLDYSPSGVNDGQQDEAENLRLLLQEIIAKHPEANAVSTGAILSTYQRMRVESVAIRLKLVPLSYLWQYPYLPPHRDSSLLEDMQNVRMDSRLIKVASGGLDETFLDRTVSDPKTALRMTQKMKYFEPAVGAILGEGGEFETLALSGPRPLWKKKIVLTDTSVNAGDGGSFSLAIRGAKVENFTKEDKQSDISFLRVPSLLDSEFHDLVIQNDSVNQTSPLFAQKVVEQPITFPDFSSAISFDQITTDKQTSIPQFYTFSGKGATALEQMQAIISCIDQRLGSWIHSTTLLLKDMADFQAVNLVYGRLFTEALPPARVTIAVGDLLPKNCLVILTIKLSKVQTKRIGLHVQSRSYWAPANIGPYSQAICEPLRFVDPDTKARPSLLINVAGQIPLVPASTELINQQGIKSLLHPHNASPDATQDVLVNASVALSLQHLWRIGRETSVKTWTGGIAYVNIKDSSKPRLMSQAFSQWDAVHGFWAKVQKPAVEEEQEATDNGEPSTAGTLQANDTRSKLPDLSCLGDGSLWVIPPCYTVLAADLPRGAQIEWWSIGLSSTSIQQRNEKIGSTTMFHTTCLLSHTRVTWIGIIFDEPDNELRALINHSSNSSIVTVFAAKELPAWLRQNRLQLIPSFGIWDSAGNELDAVAVFVQYENATQ